MSNYDRREMIKLMTGGIAGLGILDGIPAGAENISSAAQRKPVSVKGTLTLIPELAKYLTESPGLLNQLATEFAPRASRLATPQAYWLGVNNWITDRLAGPIIRGEVGNDRFGEQTWLFYATSYWGGLQSQQLWGVPASMSRMGFSEMKPPFVELQHGLAEHMAKYHRALIAGPDACLQIIPDILRETPTSLGTIRSTAYNGGMVMVLTQDAPLGERPAGKVAKISPVRINERDFMRADYYLPDYPTPAYLEEWRWRFERSVAKNPGGLEQAVVGGPGQKNLREIWKAGVGFGKVTRGGGAADNWTQTYYEESVYWTTVVNFGLEAAALAGLVAIIDGDGEAARRAIILNAAYETMSSGYLRGFLDVDGQLPVVAGA